MNIRTPDGLEYNDAGYLMSPKPENPIAGFLALIGPLLIVLSNWGSLHPQSFIQHTSLLEVLISGGFLSNGQAAATEMMLVAVVTIEIAGFPYFFRRNAAKYSSEHPPPAPLRTLWPKQIGLMIACGAGLLLLPFAIGAGIQDRLIDNYLNAKLTTCVLISVSVGQWIAAEGVLTSVLYLYYYQKYWRRNS